MKAVYISQFESLKAPYIHSQEKIQEWLIEIHKLASRDDSVDIERAFKTFSLTKGKVQTRGTFLKDIGQSIIEQNDLNPSLDKRAAKAQKAADDIFSHFYRDENQGPPTDLLHVSCTHYQSPSAAQLSMAKKKWINTQVTHLYHMGCYAALPAIRVAQGMANHSSKKIDIVHTEFCSFHFNPLKHDPEQVIIQTLFADGAIKYQVASEKPAMKSFKIIATKEIIVEDTSSKMTWVMGPQHFNMNLSRDIPKIIAENVGDFIDNLLKKAGLDLNKNRNEVEFAIHPGGPKIIEQVARALDLTQEQVATSLSVLREYGNMSSATLPHIWKALLENTTKKYVASVAFGPGITVTGTIFQVCP